MTIYIRSSIAGNNQTAICDFADKKDLDQYATERGIWVKSTMSISDILEELYDKHICTNGGSVTHRRISLKDAKSQLKNNHVQNYAGI